MHSVAANHSVVFPGIRVAYWLPLSHTENRTRGVFRDIDFFGELARNYRGAAYKANWFLVCVSLTRSNLGVFGPKG